MSNEPLNTISRRDSISESQNDTNYALYSPVQIRTVQNKRDINNKCLVTLSSFFVLLSSAITLIFNSFYFVENYNYTNINITNINNITNISTENKYFIYILLYNSCLSFAQIIYLITSCPKNMNAINAFAMIIINGILALFDQVLPLSYVEKDIYYWYFSGKIFVALYFLTILIYNCVTKTT